ncbi:MAG TPA: PD-(D/E)XK nuclease family protein, partial [Gemmatimonadota bacterium]|nr:PD-(D/E)XK nuclease family protein [Gemmatimonadota bacterium]
AWSGGRLETFRQCPHKFFQQYVLRLEPPEESRLEAEARAIGAAVHAALRILMEDPAGAAAPPSRARIDAALAAAEAEVDRVERGEADVWRSLLARAAAYIDRYFQRLPAGDGALSPEAFEAEFGLGEGGAPGVAIETTLGAVLLRGRIDRLDRDPATGVLRVVDYKYSESQRQKEAVDPARCGVDRFQLWSYYLGARSWAAREGWDEPPGVVGEVHCVRERKAKVVLAAEASPPAAKVAAAIAAAVEAAAAGDFDPAPLDEKRCAWCDYRRSCRIATVSLGPAGGPLEDEE